MIILMIRTYITGTNMNNKNNLMRFWKENVDRILNVSDRKIVAFAELVSKLQIEEIVEKVYAEFDTRRKFFEASDANQQDLEELEKLIKKLKP